MLRIHCTNVMGRAHVSIHCHNHGEVHGHVVWSGSTQAGIERPSAELLVIADALRDAERAWHQGEWEFYDEC
jgi:hypothetical protein